MCEDLDEDEVLFPYDDWYDDDCEPEPPGCGRCYDSGCPSCRPGPLRRLRSRISWRLYLWRYRRRHGNEPEEAPF